MFILGGGVRAGDKLGAVRHGLHGALLGIAGSRLERVPHEFGALVEHPVSGRGGPPAVGARPPGRERARAAHNGPHQAAHAVRAAVLSHRVPRGAARPAWPRRRLPLRGRPAFVPRAAPLK